MKGGKDDDSKIMGPLFPRLHVNDTDKGGPRAPPRNKMALYEQLSIPSQRFNSTASELHSQPSMMKHFRSSDEAEYRSVQSHNKARGSFQREYADRTDEVSETSMVDSVSRVDVSPDDVVGVIGQKHFWKARRAMANQQRVFAVQVFELHRLIKIQKLIAGSPHLLLEENPYITRPASKVSCKAPHLDFAVKSQAQIVMQIDDLERPKQPDNNPKVNPWCFQPPANQWLIPVMSPSEGLVYKPYAGPFPPARTRAIKVVPHNRRSATENAARIFQSIQRERQQNDS
ncbi:Protein EARLY FLOWERING 3 [Acorus gramineus]|uniref:Protein EARLY FLOWERING 3 n=1 Tax=Acorus gramineus TaxID=55184 RepID=A0AAV9ATN1_ACOGR|nr:Protein EARLY FLOWERING 3 [Acorus gramineus]